MRHYPPRKPRLPNGTSWNGTRNRSAQAAFRRHLIARDGLRCRHCGAMGVELQAHHTSEHDGRMLCRPCHRACDSQAR